MIATKQIPPLTENDKTRFWEKVDKTPISGCWIWTRAKTRNGYGNFGIGSRNFASHRIAFTICKGEIPFGVLVCHDCPFGDNPECCNPDHLFLGTHKENGQDAAKKGRSTRGRKHPNQTKRGENARRVRFKNEDILNMRRLSREGMTNVAIGKLYNAATPHVWGIVNRKLWTHI